MSEKRDRGDFENSGGSERFSGNLAKIGIPRNSVETKKVPVYRQNRPTVTKMLDDAYNVLGEQFSKYREYGAYSRFSEKECQGFSKLVSAVTSLQESERKQVAMMALGNLSDAELEKLVSESQRMLGDRGSES